MTFPHQLLFALVAAASVAPASWAQVSAGAAPPAPNQPRSLVITLIEGEGALNDIRTRTAREPIVEVDDENRKPVAGALILFSLDDNASSYASFAGSQTLSVQTDAAGRAVATGFQITGKKGSYNIRVHASLGQVQADALIAENNIAEAAAESGATPAVTGFSRKKVEWLVGGVLAVGAIAGILVATRGSQSTTLSAGTGTVGAPTAVSGGLRFQLHLHHP